MTRRWETALAIAIGATESTTLNTDMLALFKVAADLDAIEARLTEATKALAARFAYYAIAIASDANTTPPTQSQTLRDMAEDAVRLKVQREVFRAFMHALLTRPQRDRFAEAIAPKGLDG